MRISFDPTVKLSDVITSLSFILAILALVFSQSKDRQSADNQRLDQARIVLSTAIMKLERWTALSTFVFDAVQPTLVQTSEVWNEKGGDVTAARDYLWRELDRIYPEISAKILDEKISSGYIDLYRVSPTLPVAYRRTLSELEKLSEEVKTEMFDDTQKAVLSFSNSRSERTTAEMGNALRAVVSRNRQTFSDRQDKIIASLLQHLESNIAEKDGELLAELRHD